MGKGSIEEENENSDYKRYAKMAEGTFIREFVAIGRDATFKKENNLLGICSFKI